MRFRRAPADVATLPAAAEPPSAEGVDLSTVPLPVLYAELSRLGWQMFPTGAWEATIGALEARAERAEAVVAAEAERQSNLVDATEVIDRLAHIAGTEFPAVCEEASGLMRENSALRTRNGRLERDFRTVATAIVEGDFPESKHLTSDEA